MRVLLVWVAVMLGPAAVTAEQWLPQCAPEKSELVRSALRKRAPLEDPRAIQGDEAAELLYLLLAAEMFRETGDALPGLPFPLSSPLNRAASEAYGDYVKGLDMHASFMRVYQVHGLLALYALIAIRGQMLPPESVAVLKEAGYQTEFLGQGDIEQYARLRMREPAGIEARVRALLDTRQIRYFTNVIHLRLAELMPESLQEVERFVESVEERPVLRALAAKTFLYLVGSKKHEEIVLEKSEHAAMPAYKRLMKPALRPCLMNRGYVFNTSGVNPSGGR